MCQNRAGDPAAAKQERKKGKYAGDSVRGKEPISTHLSAIGAKMVERRFSSRRAPWSQQRLPETRIVPWIAGIVLALGSAHCSG
jgi:hypothetical protein